MIKNLEKDIFCEVSTKESVVSLLPKRQRDSHKGTYGRAAIVAGSERYTGAAYLSTAACLRAGAGYTALFTPKGILPHYMLKAPEALLTPLCEGGEMRFEESVFEDLLTYDSIVYGMGMGISEAVARGAVYLLEHYTGKLILDADGLNSLAAYQKESFSKIFTEKQCNVLLTPHVKEFSRLSGKTVEEIRAEGVRAPLAFAKKYQVGVLLKSSTSILTDGERICLNETGNSGQAKGGSGDVLSGVIAGLCASGASVFDGGKIAAYLVGRAAELAAQELSEYALTASDLIAYLGKAFLDVLHS